MEKVYFVSGIDTGVGKTVATGLMARFLRERGIDAITVKMVQTGNDGFSEDIDEHRRICGLGSFPEDALGYSAPQIFRFPASPELAARLEGRQVDTRRILEGVAKCAEGHDTVLVEAAGGLAVPLTKGVLSIDFAAAQGWPTILVTCGRLGSINHTLLSLEAIVARGIPLAGVAYNWCEGFDPTIDEDTPAAIRDWLDRHGCASPLVRIPKFDSTLQGVDFSPFFLP